MQQELYNLVEDVEKLEKKYSLSYTEILDILQKKAEVTFPISIFNEKLGSFESIVKYLIEDKELSIRQISFLTHRKPQSILTTYNRAKRKHPSSLSTTGQNVPLSLIKNKKPILENLVIFFLSKNYSLQKISSILKRNYKTIYTAKYRARTRE